mmetsp:Transcript_11856/g.20207  ORF Transcript_11856/g.20207 Transcript_11856/m.20207 type:complete len:338 (-) Transcript_11856:383-1396(-)
MGEENGFWRAGRFSVSLTTSSQSVQVTRDAEPVSVVVQQKGRFKVLASPKFPWFSSRSRRHSEVESVTSPVPAPPAPSPPPASIVTKKSRFTTVLVKTNTPSKSPAPSPLPPRASPSSKPDLQRAVQPEALKPEQRQSNVLELPSKQSDIQSPSVPDLRKVLPERSDSCESISTPPSLTSPKSSYSSSGTVGTVFRKGRFTIIHSSSDSFASRSDSSGSFSSPVSDVLNSPASNYSPPSDARSPISVRKGRFTITSAPFDSPDSIPYSPPACRRSSCPPSLNIPPLPNVPIPSSTPSFCSVMPILSWFALSNGHYVKYSTRINAPSILVPGVLCLVD